VSPAALRSLERVHAIVSWTATLTLLVTTWIVTRSERTGRAARIAGATAVGLICAAAALGLALHDPYRARLRQRLFIGSPALGWLFERKQNAAFAAVLLGLCALATHACLERGGPAAPGARDLRRSAVLAWTASAALALAASIASAIVARHARF
jgi:hypothetical protein